MTRTLEEAISDALQDIFEVRIVGIYVSLLASAIRKWIKDEVVPKEKSAFGMDNSYADVNDYVREKERCSGHNSCRTQTLKNAGIEEGGNQ